MVAAMEDQPRSFLKLNIDAELTDWLLWRLFQKNVINHDLRGNAHLVPISQNSIQSMSKAEQVLADQQIGLWLFSRGGSFLHGSGQH